MWFRYLPCVFCLLFICCRAMGFFFNRLNNISLIGIPKVQRRFKTLGHLPGNKKVKELKICVPIKKYKSYSNQIFSPIVQEQEEGRVSSSWTVSRRCWDAAALEECQRQHRHGTSVR